MFPASNQGEPLKVGLCLNSNSSSQPQVSRCHPPSLSQAPDAYSLHLSLWLLSSVQGRAESCCTTTLTWLENRNPKPGVPALAQPHLALTLPEFYTPSFVAFSLGPAILVTLDKSLSCSTPPPLIGKKNTERLVAVVRTGFASL